MTREKRFYNEAIDRKKNSGKNNGFAICKYERLKRVRVKMREWHEMRMWFIEKCATCRQDIAKL